MAGERLDVHVADLGQRVLRVEAQASYGNLVHPVLENPNAQRLRWRSLRMIGIPKMGFFHTGELEKFLIESIGDVRFEELKIPLAVVATNARFAEVLMPMLVFPLVAPVIVAGVASTGALIGALPEQDVDAWVGLMFAFDLVYAAAGQAIFRHLVTE